MIHISKPREFWIFPELTKRAQIVKYKQPMKSEIITRCEIEKWHDPPSASFDNLIEDVRSFSEEFQKFRLKILKSMGRRYVGEIPSFRYFVWVQKLADGDLGQPGGDTWLILTLINTPSISLRHYRTVPVRQLPDSYEPPKTFSLGQEILSFFDYSRNTTSFRI